MKKILKGFTLAELLLCVGIIGIVTAMGVTIAHKSTNHAYNMYFRTGYENLYDALFDIEKRRVAVANANYLTAPDMANELAKLFTDRQNAPFANQYYTITARNGIRIRLHGDGVSRDTFGGQTGGYIFEMLIPVPKTRQNQNGFVQEIFLYNAKMGLLVPLPPKNGAPDLQNRKDLLAFYEFDGQQGSVRYEADGTASYTKIQPKTFREAACEMYGDLVVTLPEAYKIENANEGDQVEQWGDGEANWNWNPGTITHVVDCNNPISINKIDGRSDSAVLKLYTGRI